MPVVATVFIGKRLQYRHLTVRRGGLIVETKYPCRNLSQRCREAYRWGGGRNCRILWYIIYAAYQVRRWWPSVLCTQNPDTHSGYILSHPEVDFPQSRTHYVHTSPSENHQLITLAIITGTLHSINHTSALTFLSLCSNRDGKAFINVFRLITLAPNSLQRNTSITHQLIQNKVHSLLKISCKS